ncbi:DEAD/DEAH box helicase family protein [Kineosporia mesophila]|uniref:DEAD/DEAH box helicase family protein n=1 Tax=Kineosporia mesophila TaxID=566012 RepID=A0ABP7A0I0_9ACTN
MVRELSYASKPSGKGKRLDLTLFLNGIPIATAELKNGFTKQNADDAKKQYRTDRDPTELIFAHRTVAHFAVDQDLVFVTSQLRGERTRFLPFNTGSNGPGNSGGKGNAVGEGYATSYLWKEIWQPDTWLDLLERYVHLHKEKGADGRIRKSLIFPRYHQWHAVRRLTQHAARCGAGRDYLIMASAGSGKSNTIAWLAHRLSSLHSPTDVAELDPDAVEKGLEPGKPVFDKVIVITDRRNLDGQLRETVGSFEQTAGLVVSVDENRGSKSKQLAQALSSESGSIVTVTLQTFPALVDYLRREPTEIKGRRFAVIVDEAHSSQSGEAAGKVREVLGEFGLDGDSEDMGATEAAPSSVGEKLKAEARKRKGSGNISYFAFTATPKAKTLEDFGTLEEDGKYHPFHTYSMRQAIEEGFILDPLRNYVTYKTYWKLMNENPDDREVDPRKTKALLARFAYTHQSTVTQQAEIVVEHFRAHTAGRLGGRSKAMVVTASRMSAVQMARYMRSYIDVQGYSGLGVLVAFSGALKYDGEETTEVRENGGLAKSALPEAFGYTRADDKTAYVPGKERPEFRILVVAEKYQTGFDQPLLTTMYVNKTLKGIAAVQTLSRLNRTAERKGQEDLAILDFVNEAEDIREAFKPYYEEADTLPTDPNLLYNAASAVMSAPILVESEMTAFAEAFLLAREKADGDNAAWVKLQETLYTHLVPAQTHFADLLNSSDDEQEEQAEGFRSALNDLVRKYAFLSRIVPYEDSELERLYVFGRYLLTRLARRPDGGVDIGQIDLSHLRIEKTGEYDVSLTSEGSQTLKGFGDGTPGSKDEKTLLSELVERFNERFGTEFSEADLLQPFEEAMADPEVQQAALVNDEENFGLKFEPVFEEKIMNHVDSVANLGKLYFGDQPDVRNTLNRSARRAAWRLIRKQNGLDDVA